MQTQATYSDQLLEGIANAVDLEIWDVAESLARTLAHHIQRTGEYPRLLPREQIEQLVGLYQKSRAQGAN